MLGTHDILVLNVSEQVEVSEYAMLLISLYMGTVWYSNSSIKTVVEEAVAVDPRVPEIVHDSEGQVPQAGLLGFVKAELSEKKSGSVVTSVTHHLDKSWLNDVAFLNIPPILFSASP